MADAKAIVVDHDHNCRIIDAAYGLVLGAFGGIVGSDQQGWKKWNEPVVQAAAMAAAESFMAAIGDK